MSIVATNANAVKQFVAKPFVLYSFPYPFLCTSTLLTFVWELFSCCFFLLPFAFILSPRSYLDIRNPKRHIYRCSKLYTLAIPFWIKSCRARTICSIVLHFVFRALPFSGYEPLAPFFLIIFQKGLRAENLFFQRWQHRIVRNHMIGIVCNACSSPYKQEGIQRSPNAT